MIQTLSPAALETPLRHLQAILRSLAREAYLFGSLAEGLAIPFESDADVLIIPKAQMTLRDVYARLTPVLREFLDAGLPIHIILYDPQRHDRALLQEARRGIRLV